MKTSILRKLALVALGILGAAVPGQATDWYISKNGAGSQNGTNWANAFAWTSVNTCLNTTMQNGDTLYIEGGSLYNAMSITASGTANARKSVVGVDRGNGLPVFTPGTGYTAIWLTNSASYWTIKNIRSHSQKSVLNATNSTGLVLDNIHAYAGSQLFIFDNCDNLLVQNCRADRYSAEGYYLTDSCDGVTFKNCVADGTGTGYVEDPTFNNSDKHGYKFHDKSATSAPFNTNILMEDCLAMNNKHVTPEDDYEQGDGFMFEGRNDGITLLRCRSLRNSDGAYDMKGQNQVITDCIALTSRNGFKTWYSGVYTNCVSVGNWSASMILAGPTSSGHHITADYCTLYQSGNIAKGVQVESGQNTVTLNDCINARLNTVGQFKTQGVIYNATSEYSNAQNPANPPQFSNPTGGAWFGTGTNYDNATWGLTKGWNSTAVEDPGYFYEAESLTRTSTPAPTTYNQAQASAGVYVDFPATSVGQFITYTVNVPAPGTYRVSIRHRIHYNRGIGQLAIDGVNQGAPVDTYAPSPGGYSIVDYGVVDFYSSGNKAFKFTVTGKNASSTAHALSTDYIELVPEVPALDEPFQEAEILKKTSTPTATTYADAGASAGVYSSFPATAIGHNITYMFRIPAEGTYRVYIRHRTHSNRGIGQWAISGVNQGSPVDTYASSPGYLVHDLGLVSFTTDGFVPFKFTVTGKAGSSTGYALSTDYIELVPQ